MYAGAHNPSYGLLMCFQNMGGGGGKSSPEGVKAPLCPPLPNVDPDYLVHMQQTMVSYCKRGACVGRKDPKHLFYQ